MSNIVDSILSEVCIDERVKDGIFRLEEDEHMSALRDLLVRRGLTQEAAIEMSNRMLEGRFPERQAYNADGVLVTFPTPQHKQKAIKRGTHFEKNPNPQAGSDKPKIEPKDNNGDDNGDVGGEADKKPNIFQQDPIAPSKIQQGDKQLDIEPPRGETPEMIPAPEIPPQKKPQTPQYKAAEKEIAKQIFNSDNSNLSNVITPLTENNPEIQQKNTATYNGIMEIIGKLQYGELQEVYQILKSNYGK
jgi:hypothetical protein